MITKPEIELGENQFYLPIGIETEDGIKRVVTLKPMTGETEEAIGDSKVAQNAGKVITELLYGVIESIDGIPKVTKDHIRNMTVVDRDFLLVMNYLVSFGESLDFNHKCPNQQCRTENTVHVYVPHLSVKYLEDHEPRTHVLELYGGATNSEGEKFNIIEFRYPTGADQEVIIPTIKLNPGQANTALLHRITLSLRTKDGKELAPINPNTFKKMMKRDRDTVNKYLKEVTPGIDLEVIYECVGCGEEVKTTIPAISFLSM